MSPGSIEIIAPSRVTPARNFDEGAAQRINKQNGVGNYLHGRWINSIFRIIFTWNNDVFERRTSTGSGLFALLSRDFEQIWGQIVSLRVKTLSNTNLVVPRHIKKKKANFWLTSVAQKRHCLNSLLTSNVRTVNGTPIMVITSSLFLIGMKDTGVWFLNKILGKYNDAHL